jgi:hypothetical protein
VGASLLAAACASLKQERMPQFPYILMHPEARLRPAEIDSFCKWTKGEFRRLIQIRRELRQVRLATRR